MEQNGTLSLRQQRAIVALLACPTVEEAAATAKVGKTTLYTWLKDPTFVIAVEDARREQMEDALVFLRSCFLRAVKKLNTLLESSSDAIALRSATTLLDHGLRAIELQEQEERLAEIEQQLATLLETIPARPYAT